MNFADWLIGCGCSAEEIDGVHSGPSDYFRSLDDHQKESPTASSYDKVSEPPDYELNIDSEDHQLRIKTPSPKRPVLKKRVSWADEREGSLEISNDDPEHFLMFENEQDITLRSAETRQATPRYIDGTHSIWNSNDFDDDDDDWDFDGVLPPGVDTVHIFVVATHLVSDTLGLIVSRLQGMTKEQITDDVVVQQVEIALGKPFFYDADFVPSSKFDLQQLVALIRELCALSGVSTEAMLNEITTSLEDLTIFEIADLLAPQLELVHDALVDKLVEAANDEANLPPGFANPALRLLDVVHDLFIRKKIIQRALLPKDDYPTSYTTQADL